MMKIKLPRRLKKGRYRIANWRKPTKAQLRLSNENSKANKTLRWLKLEYLSKRLNESPYRLYESIGCVTLEDLAGWEYMNKLLPVERRRWKIIEGYTAALFNGHTVEELPGVIGEYDM